MEPVGTDGPCIWLEEEHVSKATSTEHSKSSLPLGVASRGVDKVSDGVEPVGVASLAGGEASGLKVDV